MTATASTGLQTRNLCEIIVERRAGQYLAKGAMCPFSARRPISNVLNQAGKQKVLGSVVFFRPVVEGIVDWHTTMYSVFFWGRDGLTAQREDDGEDHMGFRAVF